MNTTDALSTEAELTPDMMRLIEAVRGSRAAEVLYEYRHVLEQQVESLKTKPPDIANASSGLPSRE